MNAYITLMKLTDKRANGLQDSLMIIVSSIRGLEKMGGKLIGFYESFGEYDYIGIGEAPNDEVATSFNLSIISLGNIKAITLRTYTAEEFAGIVKKVLPEGGF